MKRSLSKVDDALALCTAEDFTPLIKCARLLEARVAELERYLEPALTDRPADAPSAERAEPVAWLHVQLGTQAIRLTKPSDDAAEFWRPLYAAPQPQEREGWSELIERAYELAELKYQSHTVHVPVKRLAAAPAGLAKEEKK